MLKSSCFILCAMMPIVAFAHSLTINNQTIYPLSLKIQHVCYSEFGVVEVHKEKVIMEANLNKLCSYMDGCIIQAFENSNCSGRLIGGMVYITADKVAFSTRREDINIFATPDKLYIKSI